METDMTKGNIFPILIKFTIPILIGGIFQQFYNMADTIIVGRFIGADALAAVGSTGTIMFLVLGIAQGMSSGFTVLTSQRFGAKDYPGVRKTVANGIELSALVVVAMTVLSLACMKPLLKIMNTPADIFNDAYSYISVICIGIAASVAYNLLSSFLRAVGNSKAPLYFLIFSACLNVFLDLLFIIVFKMGVAGAAWATDASQAISAILCVLYIIRRVKVLTPLKDDWKPDQIIAKKQLGIAIPMALQFGITASGTIVMQAAVNTFGSTAVAGLVASSKVQNVVTQGIMAMGTTMASYAGQNYGNGNIDRIIEGVKKSMIVQILYSVFCSVIVFLFLRQFMGLFFDPGYDMSQLMPWAKIYAYECALFYIPLSLIFVFRNTMQGCGYGVLPMLGGVVELVARLAAAVASMKLHNYYLAAGCDPIAWVAAAVYTGIAWVYVRKDIVNRLKAAKADRDLI